MIPPTAAVLTALLSLGGLNLVAAQDAAFEPELKPRFIPKQFKRQINYRASSTPLAVPQTSELVTKPNTNVPQPTETAEAVTTAPVADPSPPVVVIPITLSVDLNGVTHTITGTPPAATPGAVTSTSATSITEQPPPPPASTPVVSPASQTQETTPVPVAQPTDQDTTSPLPAAPSQPSQQSASHPAIPTEARQETTSPLPATPSQPSQESASSQPAVPTEASQDVTETPSSVQAVPTPSSTGTKLTDAWDSFVSSLWGTTSSSAPVAPATPTDISSETTPADSKPVASSVPIIDPATTTDAPVPSQRPDGATIGVTSPSTPVEVAPSSTPYSTPVPGLVPGLVSDLLGGTSSSTDLVSAPAQSESSSAFSSTDSPLTPSQSDSSSVSSSTDSVFKPSQSDSTVPSSTDVLSSTDGSLTPSQSGSSIIPGTSDLPPSSSQPGPSSIPIIDSGATSSTAFPSQNSADAATRSTEGSNSREVTPSSTPSSGLIGGLVSDLLSGTSSSTESGSATVPSDSTNVPSSTRPITPSQTESASTPAELPTSAGAASTGSEATNSSGIFPTIPVSVPLVTPSASIGSLDVSGALSTALGLTSQVAGTPVSSFQPGPSGSSATSALIVPGASTSGAKTGTQDVTESQSATVSQSVIGSQSATASQSGTASLSSPASLGTSGPSATSSGAVIPTGTKSGAPGLSSTALISSKAPSAGSTNPATPISTAAPAPTSTQPSQPSTTQPSTQQPPQPSTTQPSTQPPPKPSTTQPSTTQPAVETTPTPEPVPEPTPEPTTQASTSSDNDDWVPSTILVEPPTPTTHDSVTHATATATSTQTQLPGAISPNGGDPVVPENAVMIRLGFDERLRYSFVATTMLSSTQIFHFVPKGLQYALGLSSDQVSMFNIQPLQMNGYLATTVLAYVSNNTYLWNQTAFVENHNPDKEPQFHATESQFEVDVRNPVSKFYHQPDESVNTLFSMIDPTISIWPNGRPGTNGETDGSGSGKGNGNGNGDDPDSNGDGGASSSSSARPSSVGIGVGVVAGAAAYGAGMFWVARRYRKKRQLHQRSSSTVEQMSEGRGGGSVFAAGGRMSRNSQVSRGGSARTQMISAPVMAENSLGWN